MTLYAARLWPSGGATRRKMRAGVVSDGEPPTRVREALRGERVEFGHGEVREGVQQSFARGVALRVVPRGPQDVGDGLRRESAGVLDNLAVARVVGGARHVVGHAQTKRGQRPHHVG